MQSVLSRPVLGLEKKSDCFLLREFLLATHCVQKHNTLCKNTKSFFFKMSAAHNLQPSSVRNKKQLQTKIHSLNCWFGLACSSLASSFSSSFSEHAVSSVASLKPGSVESLLEGQELERLLALHSLHLFRCWCGKSCNCFPSPF